MVTPIRTSRRLLLIAAVPVLFLAIPVSGLADPGDVDSALGGFGSGGKINNLGFDVEAMTFDRQGRLLLAGRKNFQMHVQRRSGNRFETVENVPILFPALNSSAHAITVALDDRILVAGTFYDPGVSFDFAVARLTPALALDSTFGEDGLVTADLDGGDDRAYAVAVQVDSKVVVAGEMVRPDADANETNWGVMRFKQDGTPDETFDGNGKLALGSDDIAEQAEAIVLQGSKIVIAGTFDVDFGLVRLDSAGALDPSFGSGGDTQIGFGGFELVSDMAVAPDGKLVVVGTSEIESFAVARFSADGIPDDDFGSGGKVLTPFPGANAQGVAVQPDGKIVATGYADGQTLTVRYETDGDLDPTFGVGGKILETDSTAARAVASEATGETVVVGTYLARYRWDGSLDTGGIAQIVFDREHEGSEVTALAVGEADGKLVAVGKSYVNDYEAAVARFHANYAFGLDSAFGNTNPKTGLTLFGSSGISEELWSAVVEGDGDVIAAGQVNSASQASNFLVARVKSDGVPDPACNLDGLGSGDFSSLEDVAAAVAPGPGSKIYTAGTRLSTMTSNDYGFMQFTAACFEDNYGEERNPIEIGINVGGDDIGDGMVVQPSNGRPVLAGSSGGNIVLVRLRTAALTGVWQLDTTFGVNGKATLDTGGVETAAGLAQQSDGSLIVAGTVANGPSSNFLVARFTAAGVLDTTFGVNGVGLADFNSVDTAHALAVRDDDTIAVAGMTNVSGGFRFAVAQFEPGGFLDPSFAGLTGKTTLRLGQGGDDIAQAVAFVGNDGLVLGGYSTVYQKRQFALAAFETTPLGIVTTTTTTLPASECGDPANPMGTVTASDALFVLAAAVGNKTCQPCVCDVNGNGSIVSSDALVVLRAAVGQDVELMCAACT